MFWGLYHKEMHTFAQGGIQKYLCQHSLSIVKELETTLMSISGGGYK